MGIYFDYDYEDGKEVENWVPCFLCGEKKVLFVEYHIRKGPIYTLLNDNARKLWSGHEIKIISDNFLVCEDCYREYPSEDEIISAIIRKRRETPDAQSAPIDKIKVIESEIEETKEKIEGLLNRLGELYERLGREKVLQQSRKNIINDGGN
jgi:DNA-directed RNA polymerase subunit M/transcription elongation factor TFIIS